MTRFKDQDDSSLPAWIIDAETPVIEAPRPQIGLELPPIVPLNAEEEAPAPKNTGGTVIIFDI